MNYDITKGRAAKGTILIDFLLLLSSPSTCGWVYKFHAWPGTRLISSHCRPLPSGSSHPISSSPSIIIGLLSITHYWLAAAVTCRITIIIVIHRSARAGRSFLRGVSSANPTPFRFQFYPTLLHHVPPPRCLCPHLLRRTCSWFCFD